MQNTSSKYKKAIREQTREFKRLVEILVDGNFQQDGLVAISDDKAEITNQNSVVSKDNSITYNYASLEENYTLLDGTFVLPNKNFTNDKTGFIGNINSGSVLISPNYIGTTYLFDSSYHNTFSILFYKEYPIDFEVVFNCRYYNGSQFIEFTQTYENNNNDKDYVLIEVPKKWEVSGVEYNYDVISANITINEWSNPNHRFRIREASIYETTIFEDDEIVSLDLLEQTDFTNTSLPSNSLSIKINNYDRKFNITKLDNILNKLTKKSKIRSYNGLIIDGTPEYVYLGGYHYSNYKENENKIVDLNCSGLIEEYGELQQSFFTSYYGIASTPLYQASLQILSNDDISQIDYQQDIYAMYSNFTNKKEQAQALSIYYTANIKEQRGQSSSVSIDGNCNELLMFNIDKNIKRRVYLTDQLRNPILTKFIKTKRITFNNKEIKNMKNDYTEIYNDDVEFKQSGTSIVASITLDKLSNPISNQKQIEIYNNGSRIYTFDYTENYSLFYYKVSISIPNSTAGTRKVIIKFKEYETADMREEINNSSLDSGASIEYNNIFIRNNYDRNRVANYLFENEQEYEFETEILGDPSLEVGDTILLETLDGYHRATISKINTKDNGGLTQVIEGVCSNVL